MDTNDDLPRDGLYGRVIVPLSRLVDADNISDPRTVHYQLYIPGTERPLYKWVRPVVGFQSVGCRYTPVTLGYLSFTVQVNYMARLPWLRTIPTVPSRYWQLPTNFDPHSFEAGFLRAGKALSTMPRWVSLCFHWSAIKRELEGPGGPFSLFVTCAFHVILLHGIVVCGPSRAPVTFALLCFVASLFYLGRRPGGHVVRVPAEEAEHLAPRFTEDQGILVRDNRALYLQNPLQLHDIVSGTDPMVEEATLERLGYFSHRHCGQSAPFSEVETPFGTEFVRVEAPESYFAAFPVFAEAKNSALLTQLLQNLWFIFQFLQVQSCFNRDADCVAQCCGIRGEVALRLFLV